LRLPRGARVGFVGPNGAGKSTLLKVMLGIEPPTAGTAKLGTGVKVGHLEQQLESLDLERTPLDTVRPPWRVGEKPEPFFALLARYGVPAARAEQPLRTLSGGERTRVALARLSALEVNLLALDEPTNHLDLWACEALEDALRAFDGTLLVVSHDRWFLNRVVERLLVVEDGAVVDLPGTFERYAEWRAEKTAAASVPAKPAKPAEAPKPARGKRKFPYRKPEDLESDIAACEAAIAKLDAALVSPEVYKDGRRVKDTQDALAARHADLARLLEHWEEAMARAEG
jgi:ATP-binding cassette, subfamily F, member 3